MKLLAVNLPFCVEARRGFETGFTRYEIGLGLRQAAPSGWRCPSGEAGAKHSRKD